MADIEVTLGAKNEASQVLRNFQAEVTNTAQSIKFSFRGLAQLAGATAAVVALVEAGRALATFTSESISAFDAQNKAAIRLGETLELIPGQAANASSELRKTATELERITNVESTEILESMTGALRRGADPTQLDEMSEAAIGLARVFDRDLAGGMRLVEEATKGNFDAFVGLIPNIESMATNSERLAAVEKLAEAGLTNKAKAARDAIEASDALHVSTKRLYETVGELLAPIRDVIYNGFTLFFDFLTNQMNPAMDDFDATVKRVRDSVSDLGMQIAEAFVTGFTIAEVVVTRFEDVLDSAAASILLSVTRITNDITFTIKQLALEISWIVENIGAITAVVAMGKTTFAEAFQDMPSLGEREITENERSLQAVLDEAAGRLGVDFAEKLQERLDQLKKGFDFKAEIDLQERPGSKGKGLLDTLRELQAFESRVLTRGPGSSPIDKIVENTAKMVEEQKSTRTAIEGLDVSPSTNVNFEEVR